MSADDSEFSLLDGRNGVRFVQSAGAAYQPGIDFILAHPDDELILWLRSIPGGDAVGILLACRGVERLKRIHVQTKGLNAIERLSALSALQTFSADDAIAIDFSGMTHLNSLGGVWSDAWTGLDQCADLRVIHVSAFNRRSLEALPNRRGLESLTLIKTTLRSLSGIESSIGLRDLSISYAPSLRDISALVELDSLRRIEFDSCKNVGNFDALGALRGLEYLMFKRCGRIASISFIQRLRDLQGLGLIETKLLDQDLTYCTTHPTLRHLGATSTRGLRPSVREVKLALSERHRKNC